jgi:hypothetical protein
MTTLRVDYNTNPDVTTTDLNTISTQVNTNTADIAAGTGGGGGTGDVTTTASASIDNEGVLFNGTTGKSLKRATGSGLVKHSSGVQSYATAGTDYTSPGSTETQTNKTLTAPKFANGGFIADVNGNEEIVFNASSSAVNEIEVTNAATGVGPTIAARGGDTNVSLNLNGKGTGRVYCSGDQVVTASAAQTISGKRIVPRAPSPITSSATPAINTDITDIFVITALAVNITSMTSGLTGTPTEGDLLWIAITGTATRTIAWGAKFVGSTVALPTTTVGTARIDVGFVYDGTNTVWRCVAVA